MKHITKVISIIVGAVSSLFTIGCHRDPAPECIYGPPSMLNEHRTGQVKPSDGANKDTQVEDEIPEAIEEVPSAIYGPPEMLMGGRPDDLPESDGVPSDIYGPPDMLEDPVEEPSTEPEPEPAK